MLSKNVFKTLSDIIEQNTELELMKFALAAFVEILYANKGKKYSNIIQALRKFIQPVDDAIDKIIYWQKYFSQDSDAIATWATLIRMISSVPRKEEYVREIVLNRKFLKISMDLLSDQKIEL